MGKLMEIAQLGAPVIRQIAEPVLDIHAAEEQAFIDDLLMTVADAKGMGIAAPQVSVSKRIVIVCCEPNERYPYAPKMEPTPMVNPEITWRSESTNKDWEGCLTVPGVRAMVPRHDVIKIAYLNRKGERVEQTMEGFLARVTQHELDHLDGLVFLDRIESTQDIVMEQEWQKLIANRT